MVRGRYAFTTPAIWKPGTKVEPYIVVWMKFAKPKFRSLPFLNKMDGTGRFSGDGKRLFSDFLV
jgi:hypothetical protein